MEYPKALYLDGWTNLGSYRRVRTAEEEAAARAEGFKTLTEWPPPDAAVVPEAVRGAARERVAAMSSVMTEIRATAEAQAIASAMSAVAAPMSANVTTGHFEHAAAGGKATALSVTPIVPQPKPDRMAAARAARAAKRKTA